MDFSSPDNPGGNSPLAPEEIKERTKLQFIDMLSRIESETDTINAIHAYKQLLKIRADIDSSYYESLLLALCRLLTVQKRYGEALYYYLAAPYYLGSILNAGELMANTRLKDTAFKYVVRDFHNNRQKINVLLYNSNIDRIQNLKDTIKIACSQSVSVIDKFRTKFTNSLMMVLHCYTLEEAKRFYDQINRKVDYITYNDKMIYGVLHIALNWLHP